MVYSAGSAATSAERLAVECWEGTLEACMGEEATMGGARGMGCRAVWWVAYSAVPWVESQGWASREDSSAVSPAVAWMAACRVAFWAGWREARTAVGREGVPMEEMMAMVAEGHREESLVVGWVVDQVEPLVAEVGTGPMVARAGFLVATVAMRGFVACMRCSRAGAVRKFSRCRWRWRHDAT